MRLLTTGEELPEDDDETQRVLRARVGQRRIAPYMRSIARPYVAGSGTFSIQPLVRAPRPRFHALVASDVRGFRGFRGFGAVASSSSDPIELKARLTRMVDQLKADWEWIKVKIKAREVAWSYVFKVDSYVAGFQTIDNVIGLKYKSINDVLGGQLSLDKWLTGMDAARAEIISYAEYVKGNASVKANLNQLGVDLKNTASDYAATGYEAAKTVGTALAIATPILLVGAGLLVWKVGLPLLHSYLGGRGSVRYSGFHGRRRARR